MRNLASVFQGYPEFAANNETIGIHFPLPRKFGIYLRQHARDVCEETLHFLKEFDVWVREGHQARRLFMIQLISSSALTNTKLVEAKIGAVSKELWDQIADDIRSDLCHVQSNT